MNVFFSILIILLIPYHLRGDTTLKKLPPRPYNRVSDVSGWLSKKEKKAWEARIDALLAESDIEIIMMIVPTENALDIPADILLQRISQSWVRKDCCGLIVHTPGRSDSPRVLMAGAAIQARNDSPAEIREMILKIEAESQRRPTDQDRLNAAFQSLKTQLLPFREHVNQLEAKIDEMNINAYAIKTKAELRKKMKVIAYGFGIPMLLAALVYLADRWKKFHQPVMFPPTSPRKRFCSPYAGGGGSSISLPKRQTPKKPSDAYAKMPRA